MRVLALDLGERRIGLALSDEDRRFAFPEGVLPSVSLAKDVEALVQMIREREIGQVVVGLPLHMDGRAGAGAEHARRFAEQLQTASGVPVALLDERWTTREATRVLREGGAGRGKKAKGGRKGGGKGGRKGKDNPADSVDAVAASILLRTWLDGRAGEDDA